MTPSSTGVVAETVTPHDTNSTEHGHSSSDAATPSREMTEHEKARKVSELLAGAHDNVTGDSADDGTDASDGVDQGDGDASDAGNTSAPPSPPKSLRELAEKVGVDVAQLYDIDVPLKDGGTIKLGALKDAHQEKAVAQREIAERALQLDQRETAIINEQRLWAELGDEMSTKLSPQAQQALVQRLAERDRVERARLIEAMPELRDEAKFDAFRTDVVETLARYGFKPHEVVIGDHRQLLVLRDLIRANQRLKQLSTFKPQQPVQMSGERRGRDDGGNKMARIVNSARNSNSEAKKVEAVRALINGS